MKNKRQDVDPENSKRDLDEPTSPTVRRESSRGRHREKEDIKITKERTPASEEEEPTEGKQTVKVPSTFPDVSCKSQASPERLSSKGSPSSRKSITPPKHKSGTKGAGSGKKEKKALVSSPASETTRAPHPKAEGGKDRGRGHREAQGEERETPVGSPPGSRAPRSSQSASPTRLRRRSVCRDRSDSSHKAKRSVTSEERSGSVPFASRGASPAARKKSASPKASSHKSAALACSPPRSACVRRIP
uniref:Uncharacterized protein n=1 Tax=Salarias fasciatus TaxID=181472 RepID=A0A672IHM0_SALFA